MPRLFRRTDRHDGWLGHDLADGLFLNRFDHRILDIGQLRDRHLDSGTNDGKSRSER